MWKVVDRTMEEISAEDYKPNLDRWDKADWQEFQLAINFNLNKECFKREFVCFQHLVCAVLLQRYKDGKPTDVDVDHLEVEVCQIHLADDMRDWIADNHRLHVSDKRELTHADHATRLWEAAPTC